MATTTGYVAVKVDNENNAEEWWAAVRERFPRFAAALERDGHAVIAEPLWDELAALPGFSDGPEFAPDALLNYGDEGDVWVDVCATRHCVFDALD